jgi:hypothetical protein
MAPSLQAEVVWPVTTAPRLGAATASLPVTTRSLASATPSLVASTASFAAAAVSPPATTASLATASYEADSSFNSSIPGCRLPAATSHTSERTRAFTGVATPCCLPRSTTSPLR